MTIAATVFRSNRMPFISLACLVVAIFFLAQAVLMVVISTGPLFTLSVAVAAVFTVGAVVFHRLSRSASVVVNPTQFVVRSRTTETTYERANIDSISLSSLTGQLAMKDGTRVWLPLEGSDLVEASVLLSPRLPSASF